jgi:copper resistance protein B
MKLKNPAAHAALATVFVLTVMYLWPGKALAQENMKGMPGMAPTATPAPKKSAPSATATLKPAAAVSVQQQMEPMPGNAPGGSVPPHLSAPGVTILGPSQKWVPPHGDNRAAELLSRPMLEAQLKALPSPVEDSRPHSFLLFELLEYRLNSSGPDMFVWDFVGWFGGDYDRLWVKTEGRQNLSAGYRGEGDLQLLYGRLVAPFWDFQAGVRGKSNLGDGFRDNWRTYAVIGFQGLAPGYFDCEPSLYISERGEVSGELTVTTNLHLTQRLVLQPRFQGEVSVQGDKRFGTGSGVTELDLGLRLRYEIRREFAPYIGVTWLRSFGETARIARANDETWDTVALATGLQLWW